MKAILAPLLILAVLTMAGCSAPGEKYGRQGPPPETVRVFQADSRSVYDAALVSLAHMEFRVTKGGPAQGKIEAVSGLNKRDNLRGTRQIFISVQISQLGDESEVVAVLKEAIEDDTNNQPGFATVTPLRDTPYYSVFFDGITEALAAPK